GGFSAAAIHLPPSRQPSNNRSQQCGGGSRLDGALWLARLAGLERRAYLLSDRLPLAHRRRARLVVGLCHLSPRGPDHPRGDRRRDCEFPVGGAGCASVKLEDHPTVRRLSEQVKGGENEQRAETMLNGTRLRRLAFDCGADDASLVEIAAPW